MDLSPALSSLPDMKLRPLPLVAIALVAVAGWLVLAARHDTRGEGIEIRWHQGGVVLDGKVRNAATEQILVQGATARLGGEADQVVDWLVIDDAVAPLADANALAQLIRLGLDGWHLQERAGDGWLAVENPGDARSAQAHALAQRAFGRDAPVRLVALP